MTTTPPLDYFDFIDSKEKANPVVSIYKGDEEDAVHLGENKTNVSFSKFVCLVSSKYIDVV